MPSSISRSKRNRRGAIAIMSAVLVVVLLAIIAFALDVGFLAQARTELQRTADAAALAGAWEFADDSALSSPSMTTAHYKVRAKASQFASLNRVAGSSPLVDQNAGNNTHGDIVLGYISDFGSRTQAMTLSNPNSFNAIQVRVHRSGTRNGNVPLFFARIFGMTSAPLEATAMAAMSSDIRGFRVPNDGSNLPILPIGIDLATWNDLVANTGPDQWSWNPATKTVTGSRDGVAEANLFPTNTGASGNRGTVKIGTSNNSTSTLRDQIRNGISSSEMNYHGGSIDLGSSGQTTLGANPGLSASIQSALGDIVGQPRVVPIFSGVSGNGNNAQYTIVKWGGIRIMDVNLSGGNKHLTVQAANIIVKGSIVGGTSSGSGTSNFVYSPVQLIR